MGRLETSDRVTICYDVRGNGKPMVVCHGGPSTTHDYLVDDLAPLEDHAMLIFHDYRGSGLSDAAPSTTYTFERLADDVDELRVHLGLDRVSVLAHSMGGFVALEYALRHPEHCERLLLISCSPAGTLQRTGCPHCRARCRPIHEVLQPRVRLHVLVELATVERKQDTTAVLDHERAARRPSEVS